MEELFRDYDVAPAFPWDGPIHRDAANTIIENAPMVLCEGMTRDEATEAAHVFSGWESSIAVYRESDLTEDEEGELHPEGKSVYIPEKPMGPGMVFGMVVLGVIAAILLMSFC